MRGAAVRRIGRRLWCKHISKRDRAANAARPAQHQPPAVPHGRHQGDPAPLPAGVNPARRAGQPPRATRRPRL